MFLTQKPGLTTFYHCSDDLSFDSYHRYIQ